MAQKQQSATLPNFERRSDVWSFAPQILLLAMLEEERREAAQMLKDLGCICEFTALPRAALRLLITKDVDVILVVSDWSQAERQAFLADARCMRPWLQIIEARPNAAEAVANEKNVTQISTPLEPNHLGNLIQKLSKRKRKMVQPRDATRLEKP